MIYSNQPVCLSVRDALVLFSCRPVVIGYTSTSSSENRSEKDFSSKVPVYHFEYHHMFARLIFPVVESGTPPLARKNGRKDRNQKHQLDDQQKLTVPFY